MSGIEGRAGEHVRRDAAPIESTAFRGTNDSPRAYK